MTLRIPQDTLADKILTVFGKRRGIVIPSDPYKKFGPHPILMARKESFWKALLRGKNDPLPDGVVDWNLFEEHTPSENRND